MSSFTPFKVYIFLAKNRMIGWQCILRRFWADKTPLTPISLTHAISHTNSHSRLLTFSSSSQPLANKHLIIIIPAEFAAFL